MMEHSSNVVGFCCKNKKEKKGKLKMLTLNKTKTLNKFIWCGGPHYAMKKKT